MWWGTAIEAPDPGALARFYSELLGWPIGHEEPGTAILAAPQGSIFVVFQQATDYQAPVWPPVDGEQRPMMHFDFQVGDLESAVAEALALGATAVGLGRAYCYALAIAGEEGVREVVENFQADFDLTMGLAGCRSVAEIRPEALIRADA